MAALAWEDLVKVARGLSMVAIIVLLAFFFVPGTGKLYANALDKLGLSEPSIGAFTAFPLPDGNGFSVSYRILGNLNKLNKVETTWHYKEKEEDSESALIQVKEELLTIESGAESLKDRNPPGSGNGDIIISDVDAGIPRLSDGKVHAGIYRFTLEIFGQDYNLLDDKDLIIVLAEPYVTGLRADGSVSDKSVVLSWKVPDWIANAKEYGISIKYNRIPPDESPIKSKDFATFFSGKKIMFSEVVNKPLAASATSFRYPTSGSLPPDGLGGYWFTFSVKNYDGAVTYKKESYTGVYDDDYVETYRDLKGVDDACAAECDVAGRKENALGDDKFGWSKPPGSSKTYTEIAYEKYKASFQVSCSLIPKEKGEKRISGCTEKEVDILYTYVVEERVNKEPESVQLGKAAADLLNIGCVKESWMKSYAKLESTVLKVCEAKSNLIAKLNKIGWAHAS